MYAYRFDSSDLQTVMTCQACPEQYDVYWKGIRPESLVGYLHEHHSNFYAHAYNYFGPVVYHADTTPSGFANEEERDKHITIALARIAAALTFAWPLGQGIWVPE